ncbi:MAG: hypothetical protein KA419_17710 [Acidobacteria bacterium]|nr:hypothetical protein [Acidobacteriota bacterium]
MKRNLRFTLTLTLVAAAFLFSTPRAPKPLKRLDPAFAARGSEALQLLCDTRVINGENVLVPTPAAAVVQRLAGATEAWKKALRAEMLERMGRLEEAEEAWKAYTAPELTPLESATALADFYKRRHNVRKEMDALEATLKTLNPATKYDPPTPADVWARLVSLSGNAGMTPGEQAAVLKRRADWYKGTPAESGHLESWIDRLSENRQWPDVEAGIAEFAKRFPADRESVFRLKAAFFTAQEKGDALLNLVRDDFNPLFSEDTFKAVFEGMEKLKVWKPFLYETEARLRRNPLDAGAVFVIHHVKVYREDLVKAAAVLRDYRLLRTARSASEDAAAADRWQPEELAVLGLLANDCNDYPEAVRYFNSLFRTCPAGRALNLPGVDLKATRAEALKASFYLMTRKPAETADYWKESQDGLATLVNADREPGLPGALLTLVLGDTSPAYDFAELENNAEVATHALAQAAERVLAELKPLTAPDEYLALKTELAEFHRKYGGAEAAMRLLEQVGAEASDPDLKRSAWLRAGAAAEDAKKPDDAERLYKLAADTEAVSAAGRPDETTLTYWLGEDGANRARADRWRALETFTNYLVKRDKRLEALAEYRKRLAAAPEDEALYEKTATFIEQKTCDTDAEAFYNNAYGHFQSSGWLDKLARFYLRQKRSGDFEALTRRVVETFEGSPLESYLSSHLPVNAQGKPKNYRFPTEIYLAALDRFPLNPRFIAQALSLTRANDPAKYEKLLAAYAMLSPNARDGYLQLLTRKGALDALLALPTEASADPALVYLKAEGLAWRCRFEEALPLYRRVAELYPDQGVIRERFADLLQSESTTDPRRSGEAAGILTALGDAAGKESEYYVKAGDFLALNAQMDKARVLWKKVLEIYPADEEKWKEIATVYWDYFDFDEAEKVLREIRAKTGKKDLFAFEIGALLQSKGKTREAMEEYLAMSFSWQDRSWEAIDQLERLLKRGPANRDLFFALVESQLRSTRDPVELLKAVGNLSERLANADWPMAKWARGILETAREADTLRNALEAFQSYLNPDDRLRAYRRILDLALPGTERFQAAFTLAEGLRETGKEAEALNLVVTLHRENPVNLGVIRRGAALCRSMKRYDAAEEIFAQALSRAVDPYRREFTVSLADLLLEAKKWDAVLPLVDRWMPDHPDDLDVLGRKWSALAGAGRQADLAAEYKAALASLKTLAPDPARQKALEADIRLKIVACARTLGDPTQAIDQYVELLKLEPENRSYLEGAYLLAGRSKLTDRMEGVLAKFAAASPADYRWPLVGARWAVMKEDFRRAAELYAACMKIVPERTDLAQESAGPLEALLDLPALERLWAGLAERFPEQPAWKRKQADLLHRMGKDDEAAALLAAWAEAAGDTADGQVLARMRALREWNLNGRVIELALQLLGKDKIEEDLIRELNQADILVTARDAGKLTTVLSRVVDRLIASAPADSAGDTVMNVWGYLLSSGLQEVLKGECPAETRAEVVSVFRTRLPKILTLKDNEGVVEALRDVFQAGNLTDLLTPIYQAEIAARNDTDLPWEVSSYARPRGLWAEMSGLLDSILKTKSPNADQARSIRAQRAMLAFLQGNRTQELAILQKAFTDADADNAVAARYFELLAEQNRLADLGVGYAGVTHHKDILVQLLASRKDFTGAGAALQGLFKDQPAVWVKTNLAWLGTFSAGALPVDEPYKSVLRALPIRQLIDTEPDDDLHLKDPAWRRQMYAYAEWMLGDKARRAEALSAILVRVEANHRRREEYELLFDSALRAGDAELAERALGWLTELKPLELPDAYRRLRLADARKDEAAVAAGYERILNLLVEKSAAFGEGKGEYLLRVGRTRGLLERTAPQWRRMLLSVVGRGYPGSDIQILFVRYLAEMKNDDARAAWLLDFLKDADQPAKALSFFLENHLLRPDDLPRFGEAMAGRIPASESLGREIRLYRILRDLPPVPGAAPPPAPGARPVSGPAAFVRNAALRDLLMNVDWPATEAALRKIAESRRPLSEENVLAWIQECPTLGSWPELLAAVCDETGLPPVAARIRRSQMEKQLLDRFPTDEDAWTLGALEGALGDRLAMVRRFTQALNLSANRADIAARSIEKLLELGAVESVGPFLAALRAADPLAARTARLHLEAGIAAGTADGEAKAVDAFLRRPDAAVGDRTRVADQAVKRAATDAPWAQGVLAAVAAGQTVRWQEMPGILTWRLSLALQGPKTALDGAAALLKAHPDVRVLTALVLKDALKENRGDVAGKCMPLLIRTRGSGEDDDAGLFPLVRAGLSADKLLAVLAVMDREAFGYENRYRFLQEEEDYSSASLGHSLNASLKAAEAAAEDVLALEGPLGKLSMEKAWSVLARGALQWDLGWKGRQALGDRLCKAEEIHEKAVAVRPFKIIQSLDE